VARDFPAQPAHPMTNLELVEALCAASVPLREARRVHMKAYGGSVLPEVFMGDVLKRIGHCLGSGAMNARAKHSNEIEAILAAIERGMSEGDRETRNVITNSFTRDSEVELFFDELRPFMGPHTRAQIRGR
jgi:hypothetical protein